MKHLLLILTLFSPILAFPEGVKVLQSACSDGTPGHQPSEATQLERAAPPFTITADVMGKGNFIKVTLEADRKPFKGAFIIAIDETTGKRGYGYFTPIGESKELIQPYNCIDLPKCEDAADCQGRANALVHINNEPKRKVEALWFPPSIMKHKSIVFNATVVEFFNPAEGKSRWFNDVTSLPVVPVPKK